MCNEAASVVGYRRRTGQRRRRQRSTFSPLSFRERSVSVFRHVASVERATSARSSLSSGRVSGVICDAMFLGEERQQWWNFRCERINATWSPHRLQEDSNATGTDHPKGVHRHKCYSHPSKFCPGSFTISDGRAHDDCRETYPAQH